MLDALLAALDALPHGKRHLIAVAGAPGSGKSTFAEVLMSRLNHTSPRRVCVLPMDGYHYDDAVLELRGHRARKGAPHTFDVGGLLCLLTRLKENIAEDVAFPVFDRDIEIARAGARIIPREVDIIIVEGNYLLLDEIPWSSLRPYFNLTAFLDVPESILRARLRARWAGYDYTEDDIRQKLEENDLPNGRMVITRGSNADFVISNAGWLAT